MLVIGDQIPQVEIKNILCHWSKENWTIQVAKTPHATPANHRYVDNHSGLFGAAGIKPGPKHAITTRWPFTTKVVQVGCCIYLLRVNKLEDRPYLAYFHHAAQTFSLLVTSYEICSLPTCLKGNVDMAVHCS